MSTTIESRGRGDRPYSHLLPVLEAEIEWGNPPRDEFRHGRDGWWYVATTGVLHVDRLLDVFTFPEHVRVGRDEDGDTFVVDHESSVRIDGLVPNRSRGPISPRPGLLSRVLGR